MKKALANNGGLWLWLAPLCAAAALFAPAFFGLAGLFHDDLGMMVFPKYMFLARAFQQGVFPLWDPQIWCGAQPLFSHYYTELYYVPVWPFWLTANLSSLAAAYRFMVLVPVAVHYAIAAAGFVFLLGRRLHCGRAAALCGGAVFLFSPMFAYSYSWQQVVYHHAWVPWLLAVYDSALEKWRWGNGVLGGVVFALLVLAANPGNWHLVFWLWAGWGCVHALGCGKKGMRGRALRAFGAAAFMLAVGLGLSSVYLLSVLDGYAAVSEHISLSRESLLAEPGASLPWAFMVTMLFPDIFSTVTGAALSALSPDKTLLFWEAGLSGGIAVCALALAGIVFRPVLPLAKQKRFALFFALLFVFSLLCATGAHSWFYRYVLSAVPGVGQLPRPIRYRFLQTVSMAALCAFGVEALLAAARPEILARMRRALVLYCVLAALVFSAVFFLPLRAQEKIVPLWTRTHATDTRGEPVFGMPEWFSEPGQPVGTFSPPLASSRIALYFDAPAEGEIRLSDKILPLQPSPGEKIFTYKTAAAGWHIFNVAVPPGRNLWVCPYLSCRARTGLRRFRRPAPSDGYVFDRRGKRWETVPDADVVCFEQTAIETRRSPFAVLSRSLPGAPVLRLVLAHFVFITAALVIVAAFFWPRGRRTIAVLAAVECVVFCFYGFYGGSYSKGMIYPNHVRSIGPEHPILERSTGAIAALSRAERSVRTMCSEPFHDNFGHISGAQFLMGYEMHPLVTRFKRALETALGEKLGYSIYYSQPRPEPGRWAMLDNFAVGFIVNRSPAAGFPEGESLPLPGHAGYFVHTNERAMPRVYTQNHCLRADEDGQLKLLVEGDLRRGAVVGPDINLPQSFFDAAAGKPDFARMQERNRVLDLNLDNPNRVEIDIDLRCAPALLVLADVWFDGWKAEVDGRESEVLRVNYCQRGVFIDAAGRHKVKFFFDPAARRLGLNISLAFLAMVGLLLIGRGVLWIASKSKR